MISGSYTAIVSNPYGSNSSAAQVRYHCKYGKPLYESLITYVCNMWHRCII